MTPIRAEHLFDLPGQSVLLMPSDASARQQRDRVAALRGDHDQAFLEHITVMPAAQWLAELWDGSFPSAQVLRPIQLLALARPIIESSDYYPDNCLNSLAIVRQFVDAFQLHAAYMLSTEREDYLFSPEYQAFYHWRAQLQQQLDELDALSSEQLPLRLTPLLADGALDLPARLVISPRTELVPAVRQFIDHCAPQLDIFLLDETPPASDQRLYCFPQRDDECRAVATRLSEILRAWRKDAATNPCPPPSLGVVVPDMNTYKPLLESALRRQLYPQSLLPEDEIQEPWHFEGSESLYAYPLIRAAWDLISLRDGPGELEHFSRVLRSRFVSGWPEQRSARASFDRLLRERLTVQCSLRDIEVQARRAVEPDTVAVLMAAREQLSAYPGRQLPSAWVRSFDQLLLATGWPNADDDDPVVAQCRQGFSQAMDVFRALDRQLGEVEHSEALSWLQHILTTKRFSVSRDWPCPIRILTIDDALALTFDEVWLVGLDDSALPRRASPSPFLPQHLQQRAQVAGCEANLCLQRDREVLAGLLQAAPVVNCSLAHEAEGGAPRSVCSLLTLPESLFNWPDQEESLLQQGRCEWPDMDEVRPVPVAQRDQLRGGSGLFKEYAQSPFFAFLKYRLDLREFPRPAEGLDHRLQGVLVHDTLEAVWRRLGGKAELDRLDFARLQELVGQCVDEALAGSEINTMRFGEALLRLEKTRVVALVSHWLEFKEKMRLQDFTVEAVETQLDTRFMGIPLKLRMDRIDRIGDKRLVIDYKTGTVDGKTLNSDALTEPQLPIYALAASEAAPIDGVMLAQVKSPDDLKIHVRSNWTNSVIAKKAHDSDVDDEQKWAAELKAWAAALEAMAEGILAGNIEHDYSLNMSRSFSGYLMPLLRSAATDDEEVL